MMVDSKVVNKRHEQFDVYIGRGSIWGNPFRIGPDGTREQVIEKYREYLWERKDLLAKLGELEGKRLGCYCAPLPCHGDVLLDALRWAKRECSTCGQSVEGCRDDAGWNRCQLCIDDGLLPSDAE